MRKVWNIVTTVLLACTVLLAAVLWGVRLFGMDVFVVQSGSMEPAYPVGSLVYVRQTDPAELKVGDVITFELGGGVRGTHRIVEIVDSNGSAAFRTKGDANDAEDQGLVAPADIVGKVVFSVPRLGFFVAGIQKPPGMYVAISAVAVILLFSVLPDLIFDSKKINKN